MTLKSLSLVVLIAATAALEVTAQRPDASRHHDSYVQRARMLKKRASSVAAATNDTENPCKRDTTSSSIQVVNAGGAQRAPLRAGWGASSSSDSRQGLSSSSTSSSSSSGTQWSSSSDSAAPSPSASGASDNSQGGMGVVHSWSGDDFLGWDYFTYADPTHGNVNYISLAAAQAENLVSTVNGQFKMSVSTGSLVNGNRDSVRISSPKTWKKGQLVVASFSHMPEGCGTWPAFWSIGAKQDWPAGGEIDILEGVNNVAGNTYTLHTTTGCTVSKSSAASSLFLTGDCQYQPGCSYKDTVDNSYGPDFNTAGGGVYAAYYDDSGIKIWFWSVNDVPSSVSSGSPDMSTFGEAKAVFTSDTCSIDEFFDDEQMLIINTTLMGDWAGATFWTNGCTGTLADTLANAGNFNNAYWLIDYVKIYA